MLTLRVTEERQNDIIEIGFYTQNKWGTAQRRSYLNDIDQRLIWLLEYWELGKPREEIKEGYYSYQQAQHTIFYRVNNNNLEIIGVLHSSSEFKNHL